MGSAPAVVERANKADVKAAVQHALDDAGVTLEELRSQAKESRFTSERARMAWFAVSAFVAKA
jgi:hypothetical protein